VSRTPTQVSQDIRAKLAVTLPELSLEIGTPERKFVDTVGEAISESYLDQAVHGSSLDIDSKAGVELEAFLSIFGFGRLEGRRATGVVRVELGNPSANDMLIQKGTQFLVPASARTGNVPLYFFSTEAVMLTKGFYAVDVPVQCTIVGSVGNVPPGSITSVASGLGAVSAINLGAMTGGVNVESDEDLRDRFKKTFMRNIAGTSDFYMSLALAHRGVSKVAVYGPTEIYRTQAEVPESSMVLPVVDDVKYVWNASESVFKDLALPTEMFFTPGVDYNFAGGTNATLARMINSEMEVGEVVDIEFEYTSKASRNDPMRGITNKVDIYTNGADPYLVSERTFVPTTTFSPNTNATTFFQKFFRMGTQTHPSQAHRFTRLGSVPLAAFPSKIIATPKGETVAKTYLEGVDYWVVVSNQDLKGTEREVAGIEWSPTGPTAGTELTLQYAYNRIPQLLNALAKTTKQITTDVVYHEASYAYFDVGLSLEYAYNASVEQVNSKIQVALRDFFGNFNFGKWIEMSDIIQMVHSVPGVDDVKIMTEEENPNLYGIRMFLHPESETPVHIFTDNFKLRDDQLPSFMRATFRRRANK
jgi:uncharacterized phage protein gp47/JayE